MNSRYLFRPNAWPVVLGPLGPKAAVDGIKWPLGGQAHQWRSDPAKGLPQWLEVGFGQPVTLTVVHLVFDTNIYGRFPSRRPGPEATATHYRLLARHGDAWKPIVEEKANWRRFRRHAFPAVTTPAIRLEVLKSTGQPQARLYEIRAYHER